MSNVDYYKYLVQEKLIVTEHVTCNLCQVNWFILIIILVVWLLLVVFNNETFT